MASRKLTGRDRLLAIFQEASEQTRSETDALWRSVEFFTGISATLLVVAFSIFQLGVEPELKVQTASSVASLGGLVAFLGEIVVLEQSTSLFRDRRARDRLLRVLGGSSVSPQLEYEAGLLAAPAWNDPAFGAQDLRAVAKAVRSREAAVGSARLVFVILAAVAFLAVNFFLPLHSIDLAGLVEWEAMGGLPLALALWGDHGFLFPWLLERAADKKEGQPGSGP